MFNKEKLYLYKNSTDSSWCQFMDNYNDKDNLKEKYILMSNKYYTVSRYSNGNAVVISKSTNNRLQGIWFTLNNKIIILFGN